MASISLHGRDEEMRKEARKGHHVFYVQPLGQKPCERPPATFGKLRYADEQLE